MKNPKASSFGRQQEVRQRKPPALLLAKPRKEGLPDLSTETHNLQVAQASEMIFVCLNSRFARVWLKFHRVPEERRRVFSVTLICAALFHDLGKCLECFYDSVSGKVPPSNLRHEHFSALIVCWLWMQGWLKSDLLDVDVLIAAVLSHHFKAAAGGRDCPEGAAWGVPKGKGNVNTKLVHFSSHPEVRAILEKIASVAGLSAPPALPQEPYHFEAASTWGQVLRFGMIRAQKFSAAIAEDSERNGLLNAVRFAVIVADSVASCCYREGMDMEKWIEKIVTIPAMTPSDVDAHIIAPFAASKEQKSGKPFSSYPWQEALSHVDWSRGFLCLECAAGKTMGGFSFLKSMCEKFDVGRFIYLSPLRTVAFQSFENYTAWGGSLSAYLTGTAQYDLEWVRQNPQESTQGGGYEPQARMFALGYYDRRYIVATADQFLSFLTYSYGGACLLPLLADSVLVLDEIHSYGPREFRALLAFLKHYNVPVLCMTATLPEERKKALLDLGLVEFPGERAGEFPEIFSKGRHPRYRASVRSREFAMEAAITAFREENERVLWVVNTIKECQAIARELRQLLGPRVLCFHADFPGDAKRNRYREVIAAFAPDGSRICGTIVVTTQICEMGIDLDADVLISEIASICAIIQRLGRLNRHLTRGLKYIGRAIFYKPDREYPYSREDIACAERFLEYLSQGEFPETGAVSQAFLTERMQEFLPKEEPAEGWAPVLTSGYFALTTDYRDTDEYKQRCVLYEDMDAAAASLLEGRPIDGLILSVPKHLLVPAVGSKAADPSGAMESLQREVADKKRRCEKWPDWLGVALPDRYCPDLGYLQAV